LESAVIFGKDKNMRTDWLKIVCAAGLILMGAGWGLVNAAEMEKEEQMMAEPQAQPEPQMRGGRFELAPEQIERILARIRETDPQKADTLEQLREKDPDAFTTEIRNIARERFMERMREQRGEHGKQQLRRRPGVPAMEGRGQDRWPEMMRERFQQGGEEFMKWLKEDYPDEATKLEQLNKENPRQYTRAMGLIWRKYGPIFRASKNNPALAAVLKDQMTLREQRNELLKKIRVTTDEKQKKALTKELEGIVSQQFDLIVKRKELAYEDLNKKLEELRKEIDQRKAEVEKWKGKDFKNEQVKQRVNELVNATEKFDWEN
jgi:hypothetical protein